ncbi:hypothetical protein [Nostoc sp.]|uniref:hypothetical protein n=1 Tax=Nostoc sp. TaxID=1180 RepID=UPI002FF54173
MSINYYFKIFTSSDQKQIMDLICNKLNIDKFDEQTFLYLGLIGHILKSRESSKDIIEEAFGFRPTVYISFMAIFNTDKYF